MALLFSWSHLHGIYSPARHTACLPSLAKTEFAGRHLLTEGVSDRAAVSALQRKDICVIDTGFVHSRQILSGSQSYRLHSTILEIIKRPYLRDLQALTTHFQTCLAKHINSFAPITIHRPLLPIKQLPFRCNVEPAPLPETPCVSKCWSANSGFASEGREAVCQAGEYMPWR